jgi:hypothetical protein
MMKSAPKMTYIFRTKSYYVAWTYCDDFSVEGTWHLVRSKKKAYVFEGDEYLWYMSELKEYIDEYGAFFELL